MVEPQLLLQAPFPVAPPPAAPASGALELESIMRDQNQRLFRLALSFVGNPADAEDVLQDSYVRAFERRATYAGRSGMGTWLASIVRNQAIDHLRGRRARRSTVVLEADLPMTPDEPVPTLESCETPASGSGPEADIAREEAMRLVETAIIALPLPFRAAFMLREVQGMSLRQAASCLGIPLATVKTRAHRARLMLRAELGERFPEDVGTAFEFLRERCDRIVRRVLERLGLV